MMNFGISAKLTDSDFFVIEADEYDAAFFDKRSKFVHYRPRTTILNNLDISFIIPCKNEADNIRLFEKEIICLFLFIISYLMRCYF